LGWIYEKNDAAFPISYFNFQHGMFIFNINFGRTVRWVGKKAGQRWQVRGSIFLP
jgi:hypothetical protein